MWTLRPNKYAMIYSVVFILVAAAAVVPVCRYSSKLGLQPISPAWHSVWMAHTLPDAPNTLLESQPVAKSVSLQGRWPLPDIPIALYSDTGACVLHEDVCKDPDRFFNNEDVHVRDIITSCLMKCVFKPGCRAADIGGNVGLMTYTMLALGAHVVTIEPQEDLCNVTKRTVALNGWGSRSQVHCAGAAGAQPGERSLTVNLGHGFRIGGHTRNDTVVVPLLELKQVLTAPHYDFIKIDTDSIDCILLGQLVAEIQQGNRSVDSMILETWEGHCKGGVLPGLVYQLQQLNYTVYRTLLWERHFDSKGSLPTPLAVEKLPEYATEVFDMRFARYLWKLGPLNVTQWQGILEPRMWQLFITKEQLESAPMAITERT